MALWPSLPLHHARTQQKVSKNQLFTLATPRDCRPQSAILKYKYKQYQLANCSGKSNDGWTTFGRRHRRDATQQLWSSLFWSDIGQVHQTTSEEQFGVPVSDSRLSSPSLSGTIVFLLLGGVTGRCCHAVMSHVAFLKIRKGLIQLIEEIHEVWVKNEWRVSN